MNPFFIIWAISSTVLAQTLPEDLCRASPAKGYDKIIGGIFGISNLAGELAKNNPNGSSSKGSPKGSSFNFPPGPEFPKPGSRSTGGGSGPYKAIVRLDSTIPDHTVYAPEMPPPATVKLPVIVWGNGGCLSFGTMFEDFLTEIASYGFLIVANGPPGNSTVPGNTPGAGLVGALGRGESKVEQLTQSVDWIKSGGGSKYGNIDVDKIAAAGQSCGGLEAYSASYHDERIKLTVLFNSGVIEAGRKCLLRELKSPVAFFLGGPNDIANANGISDYDRLQGVQKLKLHLDSGHMGTYSTTGGGKFGKAAVAFFQWQLKDDEKAKLRFSDPKSEGSLVKDNWYNITSTWFPHYTSRSPYLSYPPYSE
jgi:dienelactone hydrolase